MYQDFVTGKFILGLGLKEHAGASGTPVGWTPLTVPVMLHIVHIGADPDVQDSELYCEITETAANRLTTEHPGTIVAAGEPTHADLLEVVEEREDARLVLAGTRVTDGPPPQLQRVMKVARVVFGQ